MEAKELIELAPARLADLARRAFRKRIGYLRIAAEVSGNLGYIWADTVQMGVRRSSVWIMAGGSSAPEKSEIAAHAFARSLEKVSDIVKVTEAYQWINPTPFLDRGLIGPLGLGEGRGTYYPPQYLFNGALLALEPLSKGVFEAYDPRANPFKVGLEYDILTGRYEAFAEVKGPTGPTTVTVFFAAVPPAKQTPPNWDNAAEVQKDVQKALEMLERRVRARPEN